MSSPKAPLHSGVAAEKKAECLSMTGYAQARGEQNAWTIRVSVKSVNHRFLDVRFRLPEGFDVYELRLRQIVREKFHRGHIDVNVNVQPGSSALVQVNRDLLQAYLQAADDLRRQTGAAATELDVVSLLRLPGVIGGLAPPLPETDEEQDQLGQALDNCLREALAKLDEMRHAEGRHLAEGLPSGFGRISGQTAKVPRLAARVPPAFAS